MKWVWFCSFLERLYVFDIVKTSQDMVSFLLLFVLCEPNEHICLRSCEWVLIWQLFGCGWEVMFGMGHWAMCFKVCFINFKLHYSLISYSLLNFQRQFREMISLARMFAQTHTRSHTRSQTCIVISFAWINCPVGLFLHGAWNKKPTVIRESQCLLVYALIMGKFLTEYFTTCLGKLFSSF